MTENILGIKKAEVNEAIRLIKEKEVEAGNSFSIISEKKVLKELRNVFEDMEKDSVPVVSVEWLEKWCKGNEFGYRPPRVNVEELLKAVRLQAKKGGKEK